MKNHSYRLIYLVVITFAFLLASCNLFNPTPAKDWPGRSETLTALAPIVSPSSTANPSPDGQSGETSSPTASQPQAPSPTSPPPTPPAQPSATQSPCYQAELVKDVTIPDGTVLAPGNSSPKPGSSGTPVPANGRHPWWLCSMAARSYQPTWNIESEKPSPAERWWMFPSP